MLNCFRGKLSRGIFLSHDNERPHPPYSSDLAPSNIFLFPKMKEQFAGKRFANDEDLKDAGSITRRPYGMKKVYNNRY